MVVIHDARSAVAAASRTAAKANARRFTPEEKETLRWDWEQGVAVKLIAHKLKTSVKQIHQMRREMGLKPRSARKHRKHYLKVHVDEADWIKIKAKARLRGSTISAYLRYLIQRDF